MTNKRTCDVCGAELVTADDDDWLSCPIYLEGIEENSDEHTSVYVG